MTVVNRPRGAVVAGATPPKPLVPVAVRVARDPRGHLIRSPGGGGPPGAVAATSGTGRRSAAPAISGISLDTGLPSVSTSAAAQPTAGNGPRDRVCEWNPATSPFTFKPRLNTMLPVFDPVEVEELYQEFCYTYRSSLSFDNKSIVLANILRVLVFELHHHYDDPIRLFIERFESEVEA